MAYVKTVKPSDVQNLQTGSTQLGTGTSASGGMNINQRSPSTQASNMYNIRDFLNANKASDVTNVATSRANKDIQTQAQNLAQQQTGIAPVQTSINFDPNAFQNSLDTNNYESIVSGYGQAYDPSKAGSYTNPGTDFTQNLQPGNFDSIMNYLGQTKKPSATYSQGAGKMDEMLLRNDPNFANEFVTNTQNQYKTQVADPYAQAVAQRQAEENAAKTNIEAEQGKYKSAIQGYLGTENEKISKEKLRQQEEQARLQGYNNDPKALFEDQYGSGSYGQVESQMNAKLQEKINAYLKQHNIADNDPMRDAYIQNYINNSHLPVQKMRDGSRVSPSVDMNTILSNVLGYTPYSASNDSAAAAVGTDTSDYNYLLSLLGTGEAQLANPASPYSKGISTNTEKWNDLYGSGRGFINWEDLDWMGRSVGTNPIRYT